LSMVMAKTCSLNELQRGVGGDDLSNVVYYAIQSRRDQRSTL
jgi:hypothetical protein